MSWLDNYTSQSAQVNQQQPTSQSQGLPTSMDDPRMNNAKEYVASHGGNPKAAFYQLCKEKMLNPAEIINKLMGK